QRGNSRGFLTMHAAMQNTPEWQERLAELDVISSGLIILQFLARQNRYAEVASFLETTKRNSAWCAVFAEPGGISAALQVAADHRQYRVVNDTLWAAQGVTEWREGLAQPEGLSAILQSLVKQPVEHENIRTLLRIATSVDEWRGSLAQPSGIP